MGLCFVVVFAAKQKQKEAQEESAGLQDNAEKARATAISVVCGGVIAVINALLIIAMKAFSLRERPHTQTVMNVNVAFKLSIARWLNSSVILVLVQWRADRWFDAGGLVEDAGVLILLMTA